MKNRIRKRQLYAHLYTFALSARFHLSAEDRAWLDMAPIGREFGSPDYERLARLDALGYAAKAAVEVNPELPFQFIKDTLLSVVEANAGQLSEYKCQGGEDAEK